MRIIIGAAEIARLHLLDGIGGHSLDLLDAGGGMFFGPLLLRLS